MQHDIVQRNTIHLAEHKTDTPILYIYKNNKRTKQQRTRNKREHRQCSIQVFNKNNDLLMGALQYRLNSV